MKERKKDIRMKSPENVFNKVEKEASYVAIKR